MDSNETPKVLQAGAGRAAQSNVQAVADTGRSITLQVVDPAERKAELVAEFGRSLGLHATHTVARIEEVLDRLPPGDTTPVIEATGSLATSAYVLESSPHRPTLVYANVVLPDSSRIQLAAVLQPEDRELKERLGALFRALSGATVRAGARDILGEDAPAIGQAIEPVARANFAAHIQRNLPKVLDGTTPEADQVTIRRATDRLAAPLFLLEKDTRWRGFEDIRDSVLSERQAPVRAGQRFYVVEVTQDDARLHQAQFVGMRDQLAVNGLTRVDEASRGVWESRASRAAVSWKRPVLVCE